MFMFQWPKLPEILMSMRDYKAIADCFTAPPTVRLQWNLSLRTHYLIRTRYDGAHSSI